MHALAASIAVVGLCACGGSSSRVVVSAESVGHSVDGTSAQVAIVITSGDPTAPIARTAGAFDFRNDSGWLEFSSDRTAVMRIAVVDGVSYFRADQKFSGYGADYQPSDPCFKKKWASMDPKKYGLEKRAGVGLPVPGDPAAVIDVLRDSGAALTRRGQVDVRGVDTTEYEVGVSKLDLPGIESKEFGTELASMKVAVDSDGRLRRLTYVTRHVAGDGTVERDLEEQSHLSIPGLDDVTTEKTVLELYDYGASVDVIPTPTAAQTCDFLEQFQKTMDEFDKP